MTVAEAIAHYEGFYIPGSRAQRNNNPGNIEYGPFAIRRGGVLEVIPHGYNEKPRFAAFPTVEAGKAALFDLFRLRYKGLTIKEFINRYAPSSENNTEAYLEFITVETGKSQIDVLNTADFIII